jgi:hypothetical protein
VTGWSPAVLAALDDRELATVLAVLEERSRG